MGFWDAKMFEANLRNACWVVAEEQGQPAFLLQHISHEEWIQQSIALIIQDSKHGWKTMSQTLISSLVLPSAGK